MKTDFQRKKNFLGLMLSRASPYLLIFRKVALDKTGCLALYSFTAPQRGQVPFAFNFCPQLPQLYL